MGRYLALAAATVWLCGVGFAAAADDPKPDLVPLKLQLPRPMFIGTPVNLKTPNLEKPSKERRPDPLVPAGTTNVALNKPVTSSDNAPTLGDLNQVTDGDKEGIEGSYVEIGPGKQYFQIDLKEPYRIYVIVVWHYHNQARVYRDVVVQLADDAEFKTNVRTVFNNDDDNSSGFGVGKDHEYIETHEGRLIDAKGQTARYVRLYTNGNTTNDLNHSTEVEVYGKK
ncbi:MAG: hypothetical protein NTW87_09955 [Planctomycetota bacterium]|nr:hypothetical protein [Planctomycetota bacterium]